MTDPIVLILATLLVLVGAVVGIGLLVDASGRKAAAVRLAAGNDLGVAVGVRDRLERRLRRSSFGHYLLRRLRGAALDVSPLDAVLLVLSACGVGVLVMFPLMGVVGSIMLCGLLVYAAHRWLDHRVQQRIEAFVAQLPEVARVLSNAASAGLALRSAVDLAGRELADPAGAEFRTVGESMSFGQSINEAFDAMHERLPSRELAVLVQTLVIQSRTGGALVTALQNIAVTLEQRKELRREVRTVVAGAVFGGYVVTFLGVAAVFVMNLLSPGALDALVGTGIGRLVLIVSAALFGVGYFLINRLTRIEV